MRQQNHLTLLLLFCGNCDQKRPTPHGKIMSAITPLMRRVRVWVSSDLRDTKRADLQPARQVKRAPLTKEQEGKHTRGSISSWGFTHFKSITGRTHNHSVPSSSPLCLDSGFWIIFIVFVIKIFLNSLHLNILMHFILFFRIPSGNKFALSKWHLLWSKPY